MFNAKIYVDLSNGKVTSDVRGSGKTFTLLTYLNQRGGDNAVLLVPDRNRAEHTKYSYKRLFPESKPLRVVSDVNELRGLRVDLYSDGVHPSDICSEPNITYRGGVID